MRERENVTERVCVRERDRELNTMVVCESKCVWDRERVCVCERERTLVCEFV